MTIHAEEYSFTESVNYFFRKLNQLRSLENNDLNYVCNSVALSQWRDEDDKTRSNNGSEDLSIGFNRRYSVGNKLSFEDETSPVFAENPCSDSADQDSLLGDMTPLTPMTRFGNLLSTDSPDFPSHNQVLEQRVFLPRASHVYAVRSNHSDTRLSSASDLTNLLEEEIAPVSGKNDVDGDERLSYFTQIPKELGLPKQNYSCMLCKCDIGNQGQEYKVCNYDKLYYCQSCFGNVSSVIPSRVFYNWDHKSYRVCTRSHEYLQQMHNQPNIDLSKVNISLYSHVAELSKVKDYRLILLEIREYLVRCSNNGSQLYEQIRKKLGTHTYYWDAPHLYSLADLNKVYTSQLLNYLKKLVQKCIHHVYCCARCTDFGHICEFCKNPKIIFAFELQTTEQCPKCRAVYHKVCKRTSECPRCIRKKTFYLRQRDNES